MLQQLRFLFHAPSAGKPHQYNCTYFSAMERDPRTYLLARVIQFFTPGIPMVGVVPILSCLLRSIWCPILCSLLFCLLKWQLVPVVVRQVPTVQHLACHTETAQVPKGSITFYFLPAAA